MAVERAFVDTNILLTATDEARSGHHSALTMLDDWPRSGTTLYWSGQVLREYLAVATRPIENNGLGLLLVDALANVDSLDSRMTLLPEDARVSQQLRALLDQTKCGGKQIHDANIVATMARHGVTTLITLNAADFVRFDSVIEVVGLPPTPSATAAPKK